jgi:hypothetical protein
MTKSPHELFLFFNDTKTDEVRSDLDDYHR